MFIFDRWSGAQQFRGLVMIADHRKNLGRVGKIETLQILQICPRPSQTFENIYDFEFSLVGKIWDNRETVKSPIVWEKMTRLSLSCMQSREHSSLHVELLLFSARNCRLLITIS